MKVLVLNNRYPSSRKPFVASYVKTIAEQLAVNHDVGLLVLRRNSTAKTGQLLDLLIYNLKIKFSTSFAGFDVIFANHFNLYWSSLSGRLGSRHKLILHWHGSELYGGRWFRNFDKWRSDCKFTSATHIVPSEYFKIQVLAEFPNLNKVEVIPSGGVDTSLFKPAKTKKEDIDLVIGFASHLTNEKGVDFLIKLAEDRPKLEREIGRNIQLQALKYGAKNEEVIRKLESVGVELKSPIFKSEMPGFYSSIDILVFPTRRKSESLGLVPLEAMACGVPVLCPDAYACPEYCKPGESGELFKQGDYNSYIEKLKILLNSHGNYNPGLIVDKNYSAKYAKLMYNQVVDDLSIQRSE